MPSVLYKVKNSISNENTLLSHKYALPDSETLKDFVIYLEMVFNGLYTVESE